MKLETTRLLIREFTEGDAEFIIVLLNDPAFIAFIGDRNVRTRDDAVLYLRNGPLRSYEKNGFGLYGVVLIESGKLIGMCGLIRRDTLPDVDIGYAFLAEQRGHGYAIEAVRTVYEHGLHALGLPRIVAIVDPQNAASINVLTKLGLSFERVVDESTHLYGEARSQNPESRPK